MATTTDRPAQAGWSGKARARAVAAIVVGLHLLVAGMLAASTPFPNAFDELAHVSAIHEQIAHPALFPDLRGYRLLDAADPSRWSGERNYINHPSLYYLAMAAFSRLTEAILAARWVNIGLSTAALLLVLYAGWRHVATPFGRVALVIAAASFPKQPVIAAGVNNDNLAACAAAAVFAGMGGMRGASWWLAGGLAIAGWTKLTALLALATVVGCRQVARSFGGETRWLGRETMVVAGGLAVGCIPYAVNLLQMGQLLYVNEDHFRVAERARPALDLPGFLELFGAQLAMKWPASEYSLPLTLAVPLMLTVPALAAVATWRDDDARRVGVAYLIGLLVTVAIHAGFGWNAFRTIGDLTIAQTRYYNVLWPGLAFAAATIIARAQEWRRGAGVALLALVLAPTVIGGLLVALV